MLEGYVPFEALSSVAWRSSWRRYVSRTAPSTTYWRTFPVDGRFDVPKQQVSDGLDDWRHCLPRRSWRLFAVQLLWLPGLKRRCSSGYRKMWDDPSRGSDLFSVEWPCDLFGDFYVWPFGTIGANEEEIFPRSLIQMFSVNGVIIKL